MEWFSNLNNILQALIGGMITFLITAMGALFVFLFNKTNKKIIDFILGFSGGVMIASSIYSLLNPAIELSTKLNHKYLYPVFIGAILGFIFVIIMDKIIVGKKNNFLLASMTIHNIPEGLCIGVAFGSIMLGLDNLNLLSAISLTLAIGLQNFPEGMASAIPLRNSGYKKTKAFLYGSLTALPEPISAVLGCLLVKFVNEILVYLLSFASIIMILVVFNEVLSDSVKSNKKITNLGFVVGFLIMLFLDINL